MVVSDIFYFYPYLGKIPILTHIFQRGWFNHQPGMVYLPTFFADLYGINVGKYTVRPMDPFGFDKKGVIFPPDEKQRVYP